MKKVFCFVVFATLLLSGCLTTAPKGEFKQDTSQSLLNSEAVVAVCRSLQFSLANGSILTAAVNDEQAAHLVGGAGVEIVVPVGQQKVKIALGLSTDAAHIEATFNAAHLSSSYFIVSADTSFSYIDKKGGATESFRWKLHRANADEFSKACPQKTIRVRKAT